MREDPEGMVASEGARFARLACRRIWSLEDALADLVRAHDQGLRPDLVLINARNALADSARDKIASAA